MSESQTRKRRSFSDEFKQSAVDLFFKQGYSFKAAGDAVNVVAENRNGTEHLFCNKPWYFVQRS